MQKIMASGDAFCAGALRLVETRILHDDAEIYESSGAVQPRCSVAVAFFFELFQVS